MKKYYSLKKKVERQVKICEIANFFDKPTRHKERPANDEYTQRFQKNKLSLIAMHRITLDHAAAAGMTLEGTLRDICDRAGVNRTQVYEKKGQLIQALEKGRVAGTRPDAEKRDSVIRTGHRRVGASGHGFEIPPGESRRIRPAFRQTHRIQSRIHTNRLGSS